MSSRRIAGAPITWGVCEVPGWGYQMSPKRVLSEMSSLGLTATELGPDGFLPGDPDELRALLSEHDMALVAGFIPTVLHNAERWSEELGEVKRQVATLAAGGASMVVLAASTGEEGYEEGAELTDTDWSNLFSAATEVVEVARSHDMDVSLHPHYGTVIEGQEEIQRFLETSDVGICLDTGHVMVGGGDPVAIARAAADRITHVHLKDVDSALANRVRRGQISYHQAVATGLYKSLGEGDVDIEAIIEALDRVGYEGWFVLEQDRVLTDEPPGGRGPMEDVRSSLRYLGQRVPIT